MVLWQCDVTDRDPRCCTQALTALHLIEPGWAMRAVVCGLDGRQGCSEGLRLPH